MQSRDTRRSRRYGSLDEVPSTLGFVLTSLHKANARRPGDRRREALIIGAGETAYATIVRLTDDAAMWMALQRQVLVPSWRFEDLEQLDQLTVPATADLLVALSVPPNTAAARALHANITEDLVNHAKEMLEQVKRAVAAAAAADQLTAPSLEVLLVDHAHIEVMKVRYQLMDLLGPALHKQDKQVRLQQLVKTCGKAAAVIAFLTTAALQIPEVASGVVEVGGEMWQFLERLTMAVRGEVGALGIVAAASFAAEPGDDFPVDRLPWRNLPGPGGPPPTRQGAATPPRPTSDTDPPAANRVAGSADGGHGGSEPEFVEPEVPFHDELIGDSDAPTPAADIPPHSGELSMTGAGPASEPAAAPTPTSREDAHRNRRGGRALPGHRPPSSGGHRGRQGPTDGPSRSRR